MPESSDNGCKTEQSCETTENTPILGNNPINTMKEKRDKTKKKIKNKVVKVTTQEEFNRRAYICICILIGISVLIIYAICRYYINTDAERDIIDITNVTISEKWIDYTTGLSINCTNSHPCHYTCEYIQNHFHRYDLSQCIYKDWMTEINTALIILSVVACIACILG